MDNSHADLSNGSGSNGIEQADDHLYQEGYSAAVTNVDDDRIEQVAHDFVTEIIDSASVSLLDNNDHQEQVSDADVRMTPDFSQYQVDKCHSSDEDEEEFPSQQNNSSVENSLTADDIVTVVPEDMQTNETSVQQKEVTEKTISNEFTILSETVEIGQSAEGTAQNSDCLTRKTSENSIENASDGDVVPPVSATGDAKSSLNSFEKNNAEVLKPCHDTGEGDLPVKHEWLDVLGNGLLKKKTISPGLGSDSRPLRSKEVTISVETRLNDGTVAEEDHQLTFVLAEQDVIDALDLVVNLMEKEEVCTVVSDAKYCYGKKGKLPHIPPGTDLTFRVKLLDIQSGPYDLSTPVSKRLTWVDNKRTKGNDLYGEKSFTEALHTYKKCTRVLEQVTNQDHNDEIKLEVNSYMIKCQSNLSACHMMLEEWKEALQACQKAEKLDPNNGKTLLRKGKILAKSGELKKAVETLKKAGQLSPNEKAIQAEIARVTKKMQTQKETQQKMYKRMFWGKDGQVNEKDLKKAKSSNSSWGPNFNILAGSTLIVFGAILLGAYFMHK